VTICPCCGAEYAPTRLLVDLTSNTVAYGNEVVVCVVPAVTEILHVLNERSPRIARYAELSYGIWGNSDEPERWLNCIRVYISGARRVVERFGARIDIVDRRGYRLVLPSAASSGSNTRAALEVLDLRQ